MYIYIYIYVYLYKHTCVYQSLVKSMNLILDKDCGIGPKHNRQLATPAHFQSSDVLRRSVFGLVPCYNRLPQFVVDKSCVKTFQRQLQRGLLSHAESGAENWSRLFSKDNRMPMPKCHALFVDL